MRALLSFGFILLVCRMLAADTIVVPDDVSLLQDAIDQASTGDTVVVSPGVYTGTVQIEDKQGITVRGAELFFGVERIPCWSVAGEASLAVVINGSVHIVDSSGIRIEGITVTGPGIGMLVDGSVDRPADDVTIYGCNLICNEGVSLVLGDNFHRFSLLCSNLCASEGIEPVARISPNIAEVLGEKVLNMCNRRYFASDEMVGITAEGTEVVVAVIDSGVDHSVTPLQCMMWENPGEIPGNGVDDDGNGFVDDIHGWDFRDGDADSLVGTSLYWHGTFVAGAVASAFEAQRIRSGTSASLRLMDLRFLDSRGMFYSGDWRKLVAAIEYAVHQGADMINLSVYAVRPPPAYVFEAVGWAVAQGVAVVGISGNDGAELSYMSSWPELITVAAVDPESIPTGFSNWGEQVDFAALGKDVLSFMPGGDVSMASGTSFAAPLVAGTAAYLIAQEPTLSPAELENALRRTAVDVGAVGHDPETGWGIIR